MKRAISLMMALLLVCMGAALASGWQNDLSPSKPYADVPEVDLTETLGYVMFSPNAGSDAEHGCQYLRVYLPRTDVKAGEGALSVCDNKGGEVAHIAMSDAEAVVARAMQDDELDWYLWGEGTCFEIRLSTGLEVNKDYFVKIEGNAIVSEDGSVGNGAITDDSAWAFRVTGDYGVSSLEYLRDGKAVLAPQAGDAISFDLVLDGDAAAAVVYGYGDSVNFVETTYEKSGKITGEVTADAPEWGVIFLDEEGNPLDQVEFK